MREGKSIFGGGGRIANQWHRSLVRNDRVFARGAVQVRRRGEGTPPYGTVCRGGRLCPPGLDNATPCRAGPVCPAVGAGKTCRADVGIGPYGSATRGAMGGRARVTPTKAQQEVQWAGDRKGRPYESVTRDAGKESPSHGFAVPAPFRQGGQGRGYGLPQQ